MAKGSIQIRYIEDYRFPFVRVEKIQDEYIHVSVLFGLFSWATSGVMTLFRIAGFTAYARVGDARRVLGMELDA